MMRYYEIVEAMKAVAPKRPYDPDPDADKRAKTLKSINKARARTALAAAKYQRQVAADDDAEREAQKRLSTL